MSQYILQECQASGSFFGIRASLVWLDPSLSAHANCVCVYVVTAMRAPCVTEVLQTMYMYVPLLFFICCCKLINNHGIVIIPVYLSRKL